MFDKSKSGKWSKPEDEAHSEPQEPVVTTAPRATTPKGRAVIGATIRIKGDITGEEGLLVEGQVEGTVDLKSNDLTIGQSGRVQADVTANVINVEGELQGDMSGKEKVVITKTGRVHGNIVAPRVTLEDGAKFKGSIDMDPSELATAEPARPAASGRSESGGSEPKQDTTAHTPQERKSA